MCSYWFEMVHDKNLYFYLSRRKKKKINCLAIFKRSTRTQVNNNNPREREALTLLIVFLAIRNKENEDLQTDYSFTFHIYLHSFSESATLCVRRVHYIVHSVYTVFFSDAHRELIHKNHIYCVIFYSCSSPKKKDFFFHLKTSTFASYFLT